MANERRAIIPGLLLVLLGGWLLAQQLGVALPGLDQLWPALVGVLGLAFLGQYLAGGRREPGLVFVGAAAALVGAFFLAFTLGPLRWDDMDRYWPGFVLIGALAFLAQWLARRSERGLLVTGLLALVVGLGALAVTLERVSPALVRQLAQFWPLLLIIAGIALVVSYILQAGRRAHRNG